MEYSDFKVESNVFSKCEFHSIWLSLPQWTLEEPLCLRVQSGIESRVDM